MRIRAGLLLAAFGVSLGCDGGEIATGQPPPAPPVAPPTATPAPTPAPPAPTPVTPVAGPWNDPPAAARPGAPLAGLASAYDPASGLFVVHEWGTTTSVTGSDGVPL